MTTQDTMAVATERRAIEPPQPVEFPVLLEPRGGPAGQRDIPLEGKGKLLVGINSIQLVTRASRKGRLFTILVLFTFALFLFLEPWIVSVRGFSMFNLILLMVFWLWQLLWLMPFLHRRKTFTINTASHGILIDPEKRRFFLEVEPGCWVYGITGIRRINPLMKLLQSRFRSAVKVQSIPHWLKGSPRQWLACVPAAILIAILAAGVFVCIGLFHYHVLGIGHFRSATP